MQAVPAPDAQELRDNASFHALMMAIACPGTVQTLPEPGLLTVARALVDRECLIHCDDPALADGLAETGATAAPLESADHLFLSLATETAVAALGAVSVGSFLYPDDGATIVAPASIGTGDALCLAGPGVDGVATIRLGDIHPALWELRRRLCRYPEGVDLFLVDGARVIGLPRSTAVTEG